MQSWPGVRSRSLQSPASRIRRDGFVNFVMMINDAVNDFPGIEPRRRSGRLTRCPCGFRLQRFFERYLANIRRKENVQCPFACLGASTHRLVVHAAEVFARAGVNLDARVLLDEQGNLDFEAGFHRCGLVAARGTVTLKPGLRVGDLERDRCR